MLSAPEAQTARTSKAHEKIMSRAQYALDMLDIVDRALVIYAGTEAEPFIKAEAEAVAKRGIVPCAMADGADGFKAANVVNNPKARNRLIERGVLAYTKAREEAARKLASKTTTSNPASPLVTPEAAPARKAKATPDNTKAA